MLSEIGCMVVELLDYRPQRSKEPALKVPEKTRVVLHPNSETLWADICSMNRQNGAQWTDKDALEVEGKILVKPPVFYYWETQANFYAARDIPAAVSRSKSTSDSYC